MATQEVLRELNVFLGNEKPMEASPVKKPEADRWQTEWSNWS